MEQHKKPLVEALALLLELLEAPNAQFDYRLNLITKIVQDLAERSRILHHPFIWLKLQYIQAKLLPLCQKEGRWPPAELEEMKLALLFIRKKIATFK